MNVEQRLIEVFQTSPKVEPTPDLFSRVVHSIEEDRRFRRRLVRTAAMTVATLAALVTVGVLAMQGSPDGRQEGYVHRPTFELLVWVGLIALLLALGPAIRRFGRGYAADLWPRDAVTPVALLQLMDVAFYLVGAGYILATADFEFVDSLANDRLSGQLADAAARFGGLLVLLGVLHATSLFVLPLVAFVHNSTRRATALPRWVLLVMALIGLGALIVAPAAVAIGLSGGG